VSCAKLSGFPDTAASLCIAKQEHHDYHPSASITDNNSGSCIKRANHEKEVHENSEHNKISKHFKYTFLKILYRLGMVVQACGSSCLGEGRDRRITIGGHPW
jgi:hypothetical protein